MDHPGIVTLNETVSALAVAAVPSTHIVALKTQSDSFNNFSHKSFPLSKKVFQLLNNIGTNLFVEFTIA